MDLHARGGAALVIKGPPRKVEAENWRSAIFGYTGMIDVSARGEAGRTWKAAVGSESRSTLCAAGRASRPRPRSRIQRCACALLGRWQLRHNYNTDDMEHLVPELVEFASTINDAQLRRCHRCGTNHEAWGLQDGEVVDFEISTSGACGLTSWIRSSRSWEKAFIWGRIQPNPDAVRRNRPQTPR